MRSVDCLAVTPKPASQLLPFSMRCGTVSVFTFDCVTWHVQDWKKSFLVQSLLHAVFHLRISPSWASVLRTVAEYLHDTSQQPLPSSFHNEPVVRQSTHVFPDLRRDLSIVSTNTVCPASEHDVVERVTTTNTFVTFSSFSAGGTMLLNEGSIGPALPVLRASSPPPGLNTAIIASSWPEVLFFPVTSPPQSFVRPGFKCFFGYLINFSFSG